MPKQLLAKLLEKEGITAHAALAWQDCPVLHPGMLTRLAPFAPRTALLFLVPYYAGETGNLSRYAAAGDYHLYMHDLFARLTPILQGESGYAFHGFADHAPIDERRAAAAAGLGMLGENGLLIHEEYGSFVFIGEWLTDAPPELLGAVAPSPPHPCLGCGACRAVCPGGILRGEDLCLSAVTQKKGDLTDREKDLIRANGTVWGCDVCQTICPHNREIIQKKRFTPIPYFYQNRLPHLTAETLAAMSDEAFAARAFSFRGRAPLYRNLTLLDT